MGNGIERRGAGTTLLGTKATPRRLFDVESRVAGPVRQSLVTGPVRQVRSQRQVRSLMPAIPVINTGPVTGTPVTGPAGQITKSLTRMRDGTDEGRDRTCRTDHQVLGTGPVSTRPDVAAEHLQLLPRARALQGRPQLRAASAAAASGPAQVEAALRGKAPHVRGVRRQEKSYRLRFSIRQALRPRFVGKYGSAGRRGGG